MSQVEFVDQSEHVGDRPWNLLTQGFIARGPRAAVELLLGRAMIFLARTCRPYSEWTTTLVNLSVGELLVHG